MVRSVYCPRSVLVMSGILAGACLFLQCMNNASRQREQPNNGMYDQYAGSQACLSCHKNIVDSFMHSPHQLSSQPATPETIMGSFETGKNQFQLDPGSTVMMEKRNGRFYQVQYERGVEKKARQFDVCIGSGTRGQTYLYWWKDTLFQLPLTYFTAVAQWCNSPGYPGKVAFGRPITSRCLECHTTYAHSISSPGAQFEKFDHRILYGVGCEKCHGPGARHIAFQQQHPTEGEGRYIQNPATFSRRQSLDLCSLCHGGRLTATQPAFSFQPGDTLSNYFAVDTSAGNAANIDVHGNQYGLLAASKCFRMSQMTCLTCHQPHQKETGQTALFSQRCISCHTSGSDHSCSMKSLTTAQKEKNCIDCHMPLQASRSIMVFLQGQSTLTSATMRSHYIRIYPPETKKFLSSNKKSNL
ncbi:MAG TPA: multiheme c-type cytochrome [Puia sp.]|nr:multiheme c-type cytochrome [Puia sp.]